MQDDLCQHILLLLQFQIYQMQGANQAQLRKISEQFLSKIQALQSSKDWKVKEEKPLVVYSMQVEDRVLIKASITLNLKFETVLKFFSDPLFMKKIQDNTVKAEVLFTKDNINVVHNIMKLPGPISNRQSVAVNTVRVIGDKAYCGNRSCKFPVQLDKDCELAEIHAAGFILERAGNSTKVTNISDVDVKGSIPGFIKNSMAGKRAEVLQKLEEVIKKNVQ